MAHDFQFISKHDPMIQERRRQLESLIKDVQNLVRKKFTFQFQFVGSYNRNMITYDTKSNIGPDFDVNIEPNTWETNYSAKQIRTIIKNALNQVAPRYGYDFAEDSTRVLTIKVKDRKHSRILYSCDFAIVANYEDEEGYSCQQYIRFDKKRSAYIWCEQQDGFYMLLEKIDWIKDNDLWGELRDLYIEKKNDNTDPHQHSRSIFAGTVHQICQQYGFFEEE